MRIPAFGSLVVAFVFVPSPVSAFRVANPIQSPIQRAVLAEAVLVGTVVAIESESIMAEPYKGSPNKVPFQVAVIKVTERLSGAKGLTHVKVGFPEPGDPSSVKRGDPGIPIRKPVLQPPMLTLDQTGCFFLIRHTTAEFFVLQPSAPYLDAKGSTYKTQLSKVKSAIRAVLDPIPALQATNSEDRVLAATALVVHYRTVRPGSGPVAPTPIDADESRLILKGLLERDWSKFDADLPAPVQTFHLLGLSPQDGWISPTFNGEGDFNTMLKSTFAKWVAGDGAKFVLKKLVPKAR